MPQEQATPSRMAGIVQPCCHFSTGCKPTSLPSPKHYCRAPYKYLCVSVFVLEKREKEEERRKAHQHSKRNSWMTAIDAVRPKPQQSRTVAANIHKKQQKKTRRQGAAVCVALRVSARPGRKENKTRAKKCVLRPTGPRRTPTRHGSLSAPFVAAPPHACSRRGAQGRRHERVGGCASGAVGRETHGTTHRKSAATNN
ncbi:hypothetical protein TcCL_NonESM10843 [Trypanosoma cruzi]|nr:hypothetical protein TcCL_NonESM10843 [Trypanosoma cruzi]